jgi:hypothetical protein
MKPLYLLRLAVAITLSGEILHGLPFEIVVAPGRFFVWAVGRISSGPAVVNLLSLQNWTRMAEAFTVLVWWGVAGIVAASVRLVRSNHGSQEHAA